MPSESPQDQREGNGATAGGGDSGAGRAAAAEAGASRGANRRSGGRRPRGSSFTLLLFLNLGLALIALALAGGWILLSLERPGPHDTDRTVIVPRGAGLDRIGEQLVAAGVLPDSLMFRLLARGTGDSARIRAGEFSIPARASVQEVLAILTDGKPVVRKLTIAEGLTTVEVLALVAAAEGLSGEVRRMPEEGTLMPETYHYSWGDDRDALVARMEKAMADALAELWAARAPGLPLATPQEALTLASIVEKETAVAAERRRVAAVFINRLNRKMRLQSDPTVIYGVTEGRGPLGREITKADLAAVNPYNTYVIDGLPPGPVANPGRASIAATLNPLATEELYFVADGSGGHVFARTLDEHNRNVRRWRQIEQQRR